MVFTMEFPYIDDTTYGYFVKGVRAQNAGSAARAWRAGYSPASPPQLSTSATSLAKGATASSASASSTRRRPGGVVQHGPVLSAPSLAYGGDVVVWMAQDSTSGGGMQGRCGVARASSPTAPQEIHVGKQRPSSTSAEVVGVVAIQASTNPSRSLVAWSDSWAINTASAVRGSTTPLSLSARWGGGLGSIFMRRPFTQMVAIADIGKTNSRVFCDCTTN